MKTFNNRTTKKEALINARRKKWSFWKGQNYIKVLRACIKKSPFAYKLPHQDSKEAIHLVSMVGTKGYSINSSY